MPSAESVESCTITEAVVNGEGEPLLTQRSRKTRQRRGA
jgi:hypothetical protein